MKTLVLVAVMAGSQFLAAVAATAGSGGRQGKLTPEQLAERRADLYRRTGGLLNKPKTGKGKIAIVNAQTRFAKDVIRDYAEKFSGTWHIDVDVVDASGPVKLGDVKSCRVKANAASAVIVTSAGKEIPVLVIMPDELSSLVNVDALPEGSSAELLQKEIARGLAGCSGALTSQKEPSLMGTFDSFAKLENYRDSVIPLDVAIRVRNNLRQYGVIPYQITSYKNACREGWAPAPTSDVQRAIWDEIHAMPTEPLKIKPETKKVSD